MTQAALVEIATLLVLGLGPLLLGLAGLVTGRRAPGDAVLKPATSWNWRQIIHSAVLYALAFNLTFFIQELFLVVPKALTPGLRPILFHNDHSWKGESPLASLFQGTGALAIFVSGLTCALLLRRSPARSASLRLFLIWMTFNGFFQSLPQVIIGAINPRNDVGMAMDYLHLSAPAKTAAALVALCAIPSAALWLRRPLLCLAQDPAHVAGVRSRTTFVFRLATLPALTGILLIIPFRVPREFIEMVMVPVITTVIGISWLQAGAWATRDVKTSGHHDVVPIAYAISALLLLLLVFQCVLRPGIHFY